MDSPQWVVLSKIVVTVAFFLTFSGILAWACARGNRGLEERRWMPLREEET
ncbi:MAG: cbb3-type cytochrome c oxidase subunit 3 [Armatimonadetes bacterium]|nr:cbb3-type cytochrome c oxidase subunit 3 [Armatimonadota bacterium]